MAGRQLRTLIQHLRRSVCPRGEDTLSDAQLLERWAQQRDEAAFEVLLWRHGPMVLSVCRRLLRHSHDIEDAFQAAFLTLVGKGKSIRRPEALAGWLHRVAYRIALRLNGDAAERSRREQPGVETLTGDEADEPSVRDLRAVLDEEIDALPQRYRQAFILCYLEGKTHAEAARLLGRPTGTVSCWLKRGRERLRDRLVRRGIAPAAAVAVLAESEAKAALQAILVQSTCRAASLFAAGGDSVTAAISVRVAALVEGSAKGMAATKLQWTVVLGLTLSMAAAGAGMWAYPPPAKQEAKTQTAKQPPRPEEQAARTDRYDDPLPQGVIARLGTVRVRAIGAQVGLTADGKTIVAVNDGRSVKFFDAATGRLRRRREMPIRSFVNTAYLSPDGRLLAIQESDDGPLDIWDVFAGKRQHRLSPKQGWKIGRVEFLPNGKMLAVVEDRKEESILRLWDLASDTQRELTGQKLPSRCLTFSPDGRLFTASDHGRIICWHAAKGEQLWQVENSAGGNIAFTPDGRTLIAASSLWRQEGDTPPIERFLYEQWRQTSTWHAWDTTTGKPTGRVKLPRGYNSPELAIAPDNRTLVIAPERHEGSDCRIHFWDLRTGKRLRTLTTGKNVPSNGKIGPFFPDGKSFLSNDGILQRWELATGRPLYPDTDKMGHRAEVTRAVYSPDGRRLASASADGTIRLWEVATAKPLLILRGHEATDLAFTPDGKFLVSGGDNENEQLCVWDTESGEKVQSIPLQKLRFERLHLSPDGLTVTVLGYNPSASDREARSVLSRWDLLTGQLKARIAFKMEGGDALNSAFSHDGRLLTSGNELFDTATGKRRVQLKGDCYGANVFSPDGRLVAALLITRDLEENKHDLNAEGLWIRIWDAATGQELRRIPIPWYGGPLAFSPDGRYLAYAGIEDLRLFEVATGQMVLKYPAHERIFTEFAGAFVSCHLCFAPDGRTLATGHPDSTVLIWNLVPNAPSRGGKDPG